MSADKSSSRASGGPRVWAEAGVTIAVTDNPPQFVRFAFGAEMAAKSGSKKDLLRQEERLFRFCEERVASRVEELSELVLEKHEELKKRAAENDPYPYEE